MVGSRLRQHIVAAFPDYLRTKLESLGFEVGGDVIATAARDLDRSLAWLDDAPTSLGESPLELVRVATEPITMALRAAGVALVERDAQATELHPDDLYDLYPATSRDLGEDVWQVHMEWGIERARLVAGVVPARPPSASEKTSSSQAGAMPSVALFGLPAELRQAVGQEVNRLGYRVELWRNPAAVARGLENPPVLVLADTSHPTIDDTVRRVAGVLRVVMVGESVTDQVEARFMALGAERAELSARILDRLPGLLPRRV